MVKKTLVLKFVSLGAMKLGPYLLHLIFFITYKSDQ
jgi:hypothetical protein